MAYFTHIFIYSYGRIPCIWGHNLLPLISMDKNISRCSLFQNNTLVVIVPDIRNFQTNDPHSVKYLNCDKLG